MTITICTVPDGRFWFTTGKELDYGAQGDTKEEAVGNFKIGLQRTVELNIERFGHMDFIRRPNENPERLWATDIAEPGATIETVEISCELKPRPVL